MAKHQKINSHILHFPTVFQEEQEGGFTVTVPLLPGCVTFGKNLAQAKKMAKEAIELYLEDMSASGETIPSLREATYFSDVAVEFQKPVHA